MQKRKRLCRFSGWFHYRNAWLAEYDTGRFETAFPETEFTFIDAGIPSTGSTPHAFRFENDVLQKGMPDLLFVEAAVNDDTNGFDYIRQTRGMEGIIRHARTVSPEMDIVMLHFIYDPFIPLLDKGIQPQVIMNHESVANHYYVSSINLAEEVAQRMRDGEFDWKEFGGTHPAWNGHTYYAAAINRLFDLEWSGDVAKKTVRAHEVPERPIDSILMIKVYLRISVPPSN